MAIAMVIPAIITALFGYMTNTVKPAFMKFMKDLFGERKEEAIVRRIEFTIENSGYYSSGPKEGRDKRNNILQKALTMYIGEHCGAVKVRAGAKRHLVLCLVVLCPVVRAITNSPPPLA